MADAVPMLIEKLQFCPCILLYSHIFLDQRQAPSTLLGCSLSFSRFPALEWSWAEIYMSFLPAFAAISFLEIANSALAPVMGRLKALQIEIRNCVKKKERRKLESLPNKTSDDLDKFLSFPAQLNRTW